MTLKTLIIIGIIEQIVVFAYIFPTSGWWFSFFGISAIWNLATSTFKDSNEAEEQDS